MRPNSACQNWLCSQGRAACSAPVLGLLLADRLSEDTRKGVGWTLMAVGVLTTIPLAMIVFSRRRRAGMIRKLAAGEYRLYSRKPDPKTGKRRNLGTFATRERAEKHEREVQYSKRH